MNIIKAFEAVKQGKKIKHSSWMHDLGHVRLINGFLVSEYDEKPLRMTLTEENLTGWELVEEDIKTWTKLKKELEERIKHLELENDYLKYHLSKIRDEADKQYKNYDHKIMEFARISRMACQCIPAVKNNNKEEQNNE